MKRILSGILLLAMLLSLAACGEKPAPAPEPEPSPAPVAEPTTAPEPAPVTEPEPAPAVEPTPAPVPEPEPPQPKYTREELQNILLQTAFAYYDRNPYVQYDDWQNIIADGTKRETYYVSPESADLDTTIYSECSAYMFLIYYDAFGYKLLGSPKGVITKYMVALPVTDPMVVCKYGGEDGLTDRDAALKQARESLQPGDLIVGFGSSGHVMMYVGDIYGDGHEYLIHCWGGNSDMATGKEKYEDAGAIYIQDVDASCFQPGGTRGWYLGDDTHAATFAILRPLDAADFVAEPTEAALTRAEFPRISVSRRLDRWQYASVLKDEEIPVTVTVKNNGKQDHRGVPVTENLPEGQELIAGSATEGAAVNGNTLTWTVDVPAGGSVELTYRVKILSGMGQTVTFPAGSVGGLTTREIAVAVGGMKLSEDQEVALVLTSKKSLSAELTNTETFLDLDFVNRFYSEVLNMEISLPKTVGEFVEGVYQRKNALGQEELKLLNPKATPDESCAEAAKSVIRLHPVGLYVNTNQSSADRVRDFFEEYYQPGDVFIGLYGANENRVVNDKEMDIFIYLGAGRVLKYTKSAGAAFVSFDGTVGCAIKYNFFVGLRPTLTHEAG